MDQPGTLYKKKFSRKYKKKIFKLRGPTWDTSI